MKNHTLWDPNVAAKLTPAQQKLIVEHERLHLAYSCPRPLTEAQAAFEAELDRIEATIPVKTKRAPWSDFAQDFCINKAVRG